MKLCPNGNKIKHFEKVLTLKRRNFWSQQPPPTENGSIFRQLKSDYSSFFYARFTLDTNLYKKFEKLDFSEKNKQRHTQFLTKIKIMYIFLVVKMKNSKDMSQEAKKNSKV